MNTRTISLHTALTTALAAALQLAPAFSQAQSLSLLPTPQTVQIGDDFTLDLQAKDFANAILGGGFELVFDPGKLRLDSVVIPASWEFARNGGLIDNASGTLSDAFFATFSAPKSGDFLTATLTFTAIGLGSSVVTPSANASQPFVEDISNNVVTPSFHGATITVVPEPGAAWLMLAGVGLMAGLYGRRKD